MDTSEREFDVIVWGATGFTGRLTAEYLLEKYGLDGELRWAIGGRNASKLEKLRSSLERDSKVSTRSLATVVANADDENSMRALARRAKVICTTVGPYALYGNHLVAACAELGTHYCDLTGEVHWMQGMIDTHDANARRSGARVVFTCGFDCIPADLGTCFLQNEMRARHGTAALEIKFRVKGFKGGASGGTIASMLNMLEEASGDPDVLRIMQRTLYRAGVGNHYFFCGRDIVAYKAFNVPIESAWKILNESQKGLSGVETHARLSITHYKGKTEVAAVTNEPIPGLAGSENGVVIFKILRNALDAPDRGKVCIVGRNPDAIWFDDYEDRVIYDEAGLFDYARVDKKKTIEIEELAEVATGT